MAAPQWSGPHAKAKTVQEAKALFRHNDKDRREEMNHTNPHIDKSKTADNFTYRGLSFDELCKAFDDKLSTVDMGRESTGKNARTLLQSVIIYPPAALPKDKEREWFMDAGRVFEAMFGDNLLEIQFDMDEEHEYIDKETKEKRISRNHGHARLFPEVGGKLNGKAFSSREVIKRLNGELDKMSAKLYGVPMMDGTKKKGGVSVETLKAASLQAEVELLEERAASIIEDAAKTAERNTKAQRQQLTEREKQLDEREQQLTEHEKHVEKRAADTREQRQYLGKLFDESAERRQQLDGRERQLELREQQLGEREKGLDEREQQLGEQKAQLNERGKRLDEREQQLGELQKELEDGLQAVGSAYEDIAHRQRKLGEQEQARQTEQAQQKALDGGEKALERARRAAAFSDLRRRARELDEDDEELNDVIAELYKP